MRQKSDSVFLLTLVDLLVQIIFLAIFLGAVNLAHQKELERQLKSLSAEKAGLLEKIGLIRITELTNALIKLVPIDRIIELSVLLPEFKNIDSLKAALELVKTAKYDPKIIKDQTAELEKKMKNGNGIPDCVFGSGSKKILFRLDGFQDNYELADTKYEAATLFANLNLSFKEGDYLNKDQITQIGAALIHYQSDCKFRIKYVDHVNSLRSYSFIRQYFNTNLEFK